jgi:repressor of nif and glnA expression
MKEIDRKTNAMLKIISEARTPVGALEISEKLKTMGIDMPERTVRYHLKRMNDEGLLKVIWKEGRMITEKGKEELGDALVSDKVGLVSSRIETMAYKMDFDLYKKSGSVILNISLFDKNEFNRALKIMAEVFKQKLGTGDLVILVKEGENIGDIEIPPGRIGFGTLCSINFNGILLKHYIPVESKFGGVLQIEERRPLRFTDIISYAGSTLDPHEIFIKSGMTGVLSAAEGKGKILAGLREIPAASKDEAEAILRKAEAAGFGSALMIGMPGQVVLGMPVGMERVGLVFPGGLNPVAAAVEQGIAVASKALVALIEFEKLRRFASLVELE